MSDFQTLSVYAEKNDEIAKWRALADEADRVIAYLLDDRDPADYPPAERWQARYRETRQR